MHQEIRQRKVGRTCPDFFWFFDWLLLPQDKNNSTTLMMHHYSSYSYQVGFIRNWFGKIEQSRASLGFDSDLGIPHPNHPTGMGCRHDTIRTVCSLILSSEIANSSTNTIVYYTLWRFVLPLFFVLMAEISKASFHHSLTTAQS